MTVRNELSIVTVGYDSAARDLLVRMSGGPDANFDWSEFPSSRMPSSYIRRGLRVFLYAAQDGTCPQCGNAIADMWEAELSHMVSRGTLVKTRDKGFGWTASNIALCCKGCNEDQRLAGPVVDPASMARPELIPTRWDSRPILTASGRINRRPVA
jgi:hypothetical protein